MIFHLNTFGAENRFRTYVHRVHIKFKSTVSLHLDKSIDPLFVCIAYYTVYIGNTAARDINFSSVIYLLGTNGPSFIT